MTVIQNLESRFQALVDATPGQQIPDLGLVQILAAVKTIQNFATQSSATAPLLSAVAPLTQPDQGVILSLGGRTKVSIGVTVTNINTSVSLRLACTLTAGGATYPISADGEMLIVITANGSYLFTWEGTAEEILAYFHAEVGGTTAQLSVQIRAQ